MRRWAQLQSIVLYSDELGMNMFRYLSVEPSSRFPIACWAPIPLRLVIGYGFIEHGFAKLSRGPDAFAAIVQAMGVPDPHLMAWLTILTELLGGFAVILGAFVAIVSLPWRSYYWWPCLKYTFLMVSAR
jgi:hypothetical protein